MVDLFEATEVAVATVEHDIPTSGSSGMKVSVSQENLHRALGQVMRAVASKTTLPVLNNILLVTENGKLKLAATNLELAITAWVSCTVAQDGAVTIPQSRGPNDLSRRDRWLPPRCPRWGTCRPRH
ncbi:MAG: hypothetical protein LC793_22210 [Thermomicrobia bacterium]|nr:hypothetical protein [Thermomicrobia bacterium]